MSLGSEKLIVRAIILHEYRLGSSEEVAAAKISQTMGEGLVSASTLRPWFDRFNTGNYSLEDGDTHKKPAPLTSLLHRPFPSMYIPPTVRTSTVHLSQIDDFLLKQIVKKFTFRSGVNFYRSCRGAKRLVDDSKPLWRISSLHYRSNGRQELTIAYETLRTYSVEKICKIDTVCVYSNAPYLIRSVVLPEMEALGAVGTLNIRCSRLSEENVRLLLAAAKPDILEINDDYDLTSDIFENVKNLDINMLYGGLRGFTWTPGTVFELAKNRRTLRISFYRFHKEVITGFLENWFKGRSTSTLKKLTVQMNVDPDRNGNVVTTDTDIRVLLESYTGYIRQRGVSDRPSIYFKINTANTLKLDFFF